MRRIHALPQSRPLCVTQQRASRQHPPRLTSALVGVLLCALWGLARAALPAIEVGAGFERMDLQPLVELMTGGEAGLTAEQARDHPGFSPNARGVNSLGFTTAPLWVRFRLGALPGGPGRVLLEVAYPLLDQVSLTLFYPDGRSQTFEAGDTLPFDARPLRLANATFPVEIPAQGAVTGVLRMQTTGSLQFPLVLRDAAAQSASVAHHYLLLGLYYGGMLALALLACVVFAYARDVNFLLYALYLASFALLQFSLNGFSHQFLWSGPGMMASRMSIVLIATSMVCMTWLTIRFLGFWPHSPAMRMAFRVFLALTAALLLLGVFAPPAVAPPLAAALAICLLPLILAAGISSLRRGVHTARYFVVAWGIFLLGVVISALAMAGVLPSGFYTTYAMQIGSVLEVWVLALALLDRVRSLREQKETAVASVNRHLRQSKDDLERRVVERTRALEETNGRLADLARRDSLTGLLNHRASFHGLDDLLASGGLAAGPVAVIMLDIDHFKQINDRFGHLAGDRALVAVAEVLRRHIGPDDLCGRYGGEEFLVALRGVEEAAYDRAEALRREIRCLAVEGFGERTLSASLGVAVTTPGSGEGAESVISRADHALYRAKHQGRDRVAMAAGPVVVALAG
jgi:diguanylate cyclase (GGDEF)-like protein